MINTYCWFESVNSFLLLQIILYTHFFIHKSFNIAETTANVTIRSCTEYGL